MADINFIAQKKFSSVVWIGFCCFNCSTKLPFLQFSPCCYETTFSPPTSGFHIFLWKCYRNIFILCINIEQAGTKWPTTKDHFFEGCLMGGIRFKTEERDCLEEFNIFRRRKLGVSC